MGEITHLADSYVQKNPNKTPSSTAEDRLSCKTSSNAIQHRKEKAAFGLKSRWVHGEGDRWILSLSKPPLALTWQELWHQGPWHQGPSTDGVY